MGYTVADGRRGLSHLAIVARNGAGAPLLVIVMLAMMVVPLPPLALDLFFTFNIAFSLIILLVVVYVLRPLDFGAFPTILLIATLLRLALNIASTRVVLLEGHTGVSAAGRVIESFGEFVIGGNYAVGLVVFAILVIINFVVVTKGAGRISEVTARFTLDALPGKQMAIDADLNAGLISQEEARTRRREVAEEADFYGAMDGASKFVRGDAIAGIIILFINLIGGLFIGTLQHDLSLSVAMENYALLTIGDGLVAQVPSLVLSSAAAVIITRVSSAQDMGEQVAGQLLDNPRPLVVTACILAMIGLVPGMPNTIFLFFAAVLGLVAWIMRRKRLRDEAIELAPEPSESPSHDEPAELSWDDVPAVDMVGLEVGYGLIPLVDRNQGGQLLNRIKGVRKKLSQELGFLLQPVHIRDNLNLAPNNYRINLLGVTVGESELHPGKDLAINPGSVYGELQGVAAKDPAFGLDAIWIDSSQKNKAQTMGYTVVDPSTVVATHLSQLLKSNCDQLLGHDEAQHLIDSLAKSAPKLAEDLVPNTISLGVFVKVLQNLLAEGVALRDMRTVAETIAEHASTTPDAINLTAKVRIALGRMIVQGIAGSSETLAVMTLAPSLEQLLQQSDSDQSAAMGFEPGMAERLHQSLSDAVNEREVNGDEPILLVPGTLRAGLSRWLKHSLASLHVLSYSEVPPDRQVKIVATVGG
ncbi:MAG: flagellar biosynthesis protein FlhA [Pseudomonadota bacterium]